jgi:hypothetical protein
VQELLRGALLATHLKYTVVLARRVDQKFGFMNGQGEGLFAINVLTGLHGLNGRNGMPMVWSGDDNGVDIRTR